MTVVKSLMLCATILTAMTAILARMDPEEYTQLAAGFLELPHNCFVYADETQRSDSIAGEKQAVTERVQAKKQLVRDVLEGKVSLRQAAEHYGELCRDIAYAWDCFGKDHPNWSEEMRNMQRVIDEVKYLLLDEGQDPTEAVARLEAEKNKG